MIVDSRDGELALLQRSRTIAVVGASANPARPSHGVFSFLRAFGRYDARPVNPAVDGIDGIAAFPSLAAFAAELGAPDIVDVFRRAEDAPQVVRDAIAVGAKAIWFQLGVVNDDAIRAADAAGLDVVVDRCIKIEIAAHADALTH